MRERHSVKLSKRDGYAKWVNRFTIQLSQSFPTQRYADKETFLTSAYQKKLEERKQLEEDLRREEKIEGKGRLVFPGLLHGAEQWHECYSNSSS